MAMCKRCGVDVAPERNHSTGITYIPKLCIDCFSRAMSELAEEIAGSDKPSFTYVKGLKEAGLPAEAIAKELED